MSLEIAIVLSDMEGYKEISTALGKRGVASYHAASLAGLSQLEFLVPADLLVVDGRAGYAAGEGFLACLPGQRSSRRGILIRSEGRWMPDAGRRAELLAA